MRALIVVAGLLLGIALVLVFREADAPKPAPVVEGTAGIEAPPAPTPRVALPSDEPAAAPTEEPAPDVRKPTEPSPAPTAPTDRWSVAGLCRTETVDNGKPPRPIPDATVELRVAFGGRTDVVARTTSDARGRFELDVTALREGARAVRLLGVFTSAAWTGDGWRASEREVEFSFPSDERRSWRGETDIVFTPVAIVAGRVVDTAGRSVSDATVGSCDVEEPHSLWRAVRTDPTGRFRIAFDEHATAITAISPTAGPSKPMPISGLRPAPSVLDVGDVVVHAHATLHGHVTYPDGSPARWLGVHLGDADGEESGAAGLRSLSVTTDDAGRFTATGVATDVTAWTVTPIDDHCDNAKASDVRPIGDRLAVRLDQRRFVVRVTTPDGRPAFVQTHLAVWPPGVAERAQRVFASRGDLGALTSKALVTGIYEEEGCPGVVSSFAPVGSFVVIAVLHDHLEPVVRAFTVGTDRWETVFDVVLRPLSVAARLVVRARDDDGSKVAIDVNLFDPVTGAHAAGPAVDGTVTGVPPGEYDAVIEEAAENEPYLHPERRRVTLAPGANSLDVVLRRGGRVMPSISSKRVLPPDTAVDARLIDARGIHPERCVDSSVFQQLPAVDGSVWMHLYSPWDGNEERTPGGLLPPGPWILSVRLVAGDGTQAAATRVHVDVRAGKTRVVPVKL